MNLGHETVPALLEHSNLSDPICQVTIPALAVPVASSSISRDYLSRGELVWLQGTPIVIKSFSRAASRVDLRDMRNRMCQVWASTCSCRYLLIDILPASL